MSDSEFRKALEQARSEAESVSAVDDETRALLETLKIDLDNALIVSPDSEPESHDSLIDRLNEAVLRFDSDHPGLGAALRTAITSLSHGGV